MRAAIVNERGSFDIGTVPDPSPGPDELLLRVTGCGICGSDLKMLEHPSPGLVMGHEFAGEVVALGSGISGNATDRWREGDRVTALPIIGCGRCLACLDGAPSHCVNGADLIGGGGSSGAYAEFIRVSARESFLLPEAVDASISPLVEPLAVALHTVSTADLVPGDKVVVVGAGPIGLAVTIWLRHMGVDEIVVADPLQARRQKALSLGATSVVDPGIEGLGQAVVRVLGRPADVIFECVGRPGLLDGCIAAARIGGQIILAGGASAPDTFLPVMGMLKELSLRFCVYYRRSEWAYTIKMLAQDRIDPSPLVSDRVGLDHFAATFADVQTRPADHLKVILDPSAV
jgi:(R,R)-butanediol dehydrogenase / meso-butanediol dehydrogenase / diacetyl reductase